MFVATQLTAYAQSAAFAFDPQHTQIKFTLGDVLHNVHGSFQLKSGSLQFDPVTGSMTGDIVVDAKSGQSGNGMRDRKMHREILESERYSEIVFRPDKVQGTIAAQGKSSVTIHGMFSIHGTDHEMNVPAEIEILPDHWTAAVHFIVPYVKWGMKNPSTLFLRVSDSVLIDVQASGTAMKRAGAAASR